MKIITLYQCEICGKKHEKEADCVECEKVHSRPESIVKAEYTPFYQFPHTLIVNFSSGHNVTYFIADSDN